MKKIILNSSNTTEAGEFRDAGAVLDVGEKADVSSARARELVAAHRAEEYKPAVHDVDPIEAGD